MEITLCCDRGDLLREYGLREQKTCVLKQRRRIYLCFIIQIILTCFHHLITPTSYLTQTNIEGKTEADGNNKPMDDAEIENKQAKKQSPKLVYVPGSNANKFMIPSSKDASQESSTSSAQQQRLIVCRPGPNDCLFGRGSVINKHPGNVHFRTFLQSKWVEQYKLASRQNKGTILKELVEEWRQLNGTFLEQQKVDNLGEVWVDVGDELAKDKCGKAIRDIAAKGLSDVWGDKDGEEEDGKDRPRRPLNTFMLFHQDMYAKIAAHVKEGNPNVTPQEVVSKKGDCSLTRHILSCHTSFFSNEVLLNCSSPFFFCHDFGLLVSEGG